MTRWTRETIIEKILEWNVRFGEPPCSADWNPSLARWRAQEWRIERYRDGIWPSTNAAKRPFDGSFDAAVRAAGLEPHRSGPRRRPAGVARPAMEQREPQAPRSVDEALLESSERIRTMERRIASLEREVAAAERRADRAEDQLGDARVRARRAGERERRARGARERVQVVEREAGEQVEMLTADANARVRAAYDQAQAAVADTHEARRAARAAEVRAADAEARARAAERLLAEASTDSAAVGAAMSAARASEERAAAAERRARELATLVCGEPRQLTRGELARLREAGPTGPAVMANALRTLHKARAAGDRRGLTDALGDVASAAVGWRDRL
ncbi:hypothetical protein OM076_32580 [Solirubrobacter ginsenosidimutans]|uniref:Uncharacterized protein n=1 Tax=Solirubrobacter ginsenosidimutans TaxID=490573 RepID=A0A9X3MXY5_9ACTN|nr:hypothetical protein [Solirubrobacter ginsenosidimutans]MDA0165051.1 hypothetical protein [Solirubrobacter ginsenosidimutans]